MKGRGSAIVKGRKGEGDQKKEQDKARRPEAEAYRCSVSEQGVNCILGADLASSVRSFSVRPFSFSPVQSELPECSLGGTFLFVHATLKDKIKNVLFKRN